MSFTVTNAGTDSKTVSGYTRSTVMSTITRLGIATATTVLNNSSSSAAVVAIANIKSTTVVVLANAAIAITTTTSTNLYSNSNSTATANLPLYKVYKVFPLSCRDGAEQDSDENGASKNRLNLETRLSDSSGNSNNRLSHPPLCVSNNNANCNNSLHRLRWGGGSPASEGLVTGNILHYGESSEVRNGIVCTLSQYSQSSEPRNRIAVSLNILRLLLNTVGCQADMLRLVLGDTLLNHKAAPLLRTCVLAQDWNTSGGLDSFAVNHFFGGCNV